MNNAILLPVLIHVFLVLILYIRLSVVKIRAYKNKEVDLSRSALHADAWPNYVQQVNNNIRNQFEVPLLFYVVSFSLLAMQATPKFVIVLSWLFILSRIAHSFVHLGSNKVPLRRNLFTIGALIVLIQLIFAFYIFFIRS